jgi:hypothetical protein
MHDKTSRWLDSELPHELQRVLASATEDGGDAGQMARLQARLEAKLGPSLSRHEPLAEHAGGPSGAAVGERALGALKNLGLPGAIAAGALAALVGLGALSFGAHPQERERAPDPLSNSATTEHAQPRVDAPIVAEPATPAPPPAAVAVVAEPRDNAPAATAAPAAQPRRGLGEELRQLEAIRRQLTRHPARALAAADRHARSFPDGTLGPERELLRVEALLLLDQRERAQALADRILGTPGGSPYAAQLRRLLSEP